LVLNGHEKLFATKKKLVKSGFIVYFYCPVLWFYTAEHAECAEKKDGKYNIDGE